MEVTSASARAASFARARIQAAVGARCRHHEHELAPAGGLAEDNVLVASGELGSVVRLLNSGQSWKVVSIAYPNMNTPPELRSLIITNDDTLIAAGVPARSCAPRTRDEPGK